MQEVFRALLREAQGRAPDELPLQMMAHTGLVGVDSGPEGLMSGEAWLIGGNYTICITMAIRTVVRKWGNSLGVVIPREEASKEGIRENDEVEIVIRKAADIRELFGKFKFKDLQRVKEEIRKGWQ